MTFGSSDPKTIAVNESQPYDIWIPGIGGGFNPHNGAFEIALTYLDITGTHHRTTADVSFSFHYLAHGAPWYEWVVKDQRVTAAGRRTILAA
jgi:hypothetical protein